MGISAQEMALEYTTDNLETKIFAKEYDLPRSDLTLSTLKPLTGMRVYSAWFSVTYQLLP